jgi:hypothetical protein
MVWRFFLSVISIAFSSYILINVFYPGIITLDAFTSYQQAIEMNSIGDWRSYLLPLIWRLFLGKYDFSAAYVIQSVLFVLGVNLLLRSFFPKSAVASSAGTVAMTLFPPIMVAMAFFSRESLMTLLFVWIIVFMVKIHYAGANQRLRILLSIAVLTVIFLFMIIRDNWLLVLFFCYWLSEYWTKANCKKQWMVAIGMFFILIFANSLFYITGVAHKEYSYSQVMAYDIANASLSTNRNMFKEVFLDQPRNIQSDRLIEFLKQHVHEFNYSDYLAYHSYEYNVKEIFQFSSNNRRSICLLWLSATAGHPIAYFANHYAVWHTLFFAEDQTMYGEFQAESMNPQMVSGAKLFFYDYRIKSFFFGPVFWFSSKLFLYCWYVFTILLVFVMACREKLYLACRVSSAGVLFIIWRFFALSMVVPRYGLLLYIVAGLAFFAYMHDKLSMDKTARNGH